MTNFTRLQEALVGPLSLPADPEFALELSGFVLTHTHSPEAVVGVVSAADVQACLVFAREAGLAVRIVCTGHGAHADIADGLVISTRRLDSVVIDGETGIATIGAGALWSAVITAGAESGFTAICGSAATVGVVGYLLGGGVGPLARSHGISSDYVTGFTVVTPDGVVRRADPDNDADLYWALRGGKVGLAVVVEVSVQLVRLPELTAGNVLFEADHIETALRSWAEYTATASDLVTTSAAIIRFPPLDFVPPLVRGKTVLAVRFAYPGSYEDAARHLSPVRGWAPILLDSVRPIAPHELPTIHMDPEQPVLTTTTGGLLDRIDDELITRLLDVVGPEHRVPLVAVELRHIGAATHVDVPSGSAAGARGADFTYNIVGALMQPGIRPVVDAVMAETLAALQPWVSTRTAVNFMGAPRDASHFDSAWEPADAARLQSIRLKFDPERVLVDGWHAAG